MKRKGFLILALVLIFALMAMPVSANGNLIINGDFEAGNTGFNSDYGYRDEVSGVQNELYPPFVYGVGTDPNLYHNSWASFVDHTSGSGNMMIINAAQDPAKIVWGQDVTLTVCPEYESFTLYAGQNWDIGEVWVKHEEGTICVKLVITDEAAIAEGWLITEAHVAVGAEPNEIPQTKKGNPIPGQFTINEELNPGVTETEWYCLDYEWTIDMEVIVAAHAKIELSEIGYMVEENFCVTSGADTNLVMGGNAVIPTYNPWGELEDWVNDIQYCPDIADWIWDASVATAYYADNGGMVDFVQNFDINGTPTSAIFKIAADNSFAFSFNGTEEVYENLADDWRIQVALDNFHPYDVIIDPNPSGWQTVYTYTNILDQLTDGNNVLNVTGVNADWDASSWTGNPAAVIYKLCGTSEYYFIERPYDSESGWGGEGEFYGKNWDKYITYNPVECPTEYTFSFFAANSYPSAPALLDVYINGEYVDSADLSNIDPITATWELFSFEWDAGVATNANIVIKDSTAEFSGDDYCLDDISLLLNP